MLVRHGAGEDHVLVKTYPEETGVDMSQHLQEHIAAPPVGATPPGPPLPRRLAGLWAGVRAGLGAALGLVPHLLHHVGLLAGAAVLTGAVGNGVFYVVGLVFSIPLLRKMRARFGSRWAPALGVAVFTVLFALSAFVVGPAIGGEAEAPPPAEPAVVQDHDVHH